MSSCHLLLGCPLDLFPLLGCCSVQRLVLLLSFILAMCPAHLHFCFGVYSIMSIIFVLLLLSDTIYLHRNGSRSPHFHLPSSFSLSFFLFFLFSFLNKLSLNALLFLGSHFTGSRQYKRYPNLTVRFSLCKVWGPDETVAEHAIHGINHVKRETATQLTTLAVHLHVYNGPRRCGRWGRRGRGWGGGGGAGGWRGGKSKGRG